MAKNTRILTDIAFKKLSNASITNPGSSEFQEPIGTNVQLGLGTILGETPPTVPPTTLFETSSGAVVQYVEFDLVAIAEGNYDANEYSTDNNSNYDDIDGNPGIEDHAFAVVLSGSYQTDGADNPKSGTGLFTNGTHLSGSNGALQLVPPSYGVAYQAVIIDENGDPLNPAVHPNNFYIDYYAGIVFRQDGGSSPYPTKLKAYLYTGDYADTTIRSGSFSGSFEGDGTNLDLSNNSTIPTAYGDSDVTDHINTLGVLSGSAQIATEISGAFTGASASFSTRVTANESNISTNTGNISTLNTKTLISGSAEGTSQGQIKLNGVDVNIKDLGTNDSPTFSNLTLSGDLTVEGTTTTVNSTTVNISSSIVRVNYGGAVAEGGIEVTDATGGNKITGSLLWDGTNDYWKGGPKGSEAKLLRETGDGILSGSAQIANDISGSLGANASLIRSLTASTISGSFTLPSSSFSTRVTTLETNNTGTNTGDQDLSTYALIANISGAFVEPSGGFSTRVTTLETNNTGTNTGDQDLSSYALIANISGAFTEPSGGFSTRVTTLETNNTGTNTGDQDLSTYALIASISGAFAEPSGGFSTRVTTLETNNTGTNTGDQDLSTYALIANISGAFVAPSASFSTRVTSNESAISALQGNEVHTAAAISGAIDAATGSLFNGTPLDNQIAVFTDHNTIEGSSNLTFNGTLLTAATASISQNLTVGGDLTVQGTTTTVNSTEVEIGDNIIILNSATAAANAGIHVFDGDSAGVTGSLVYDYDSNYWIAGTQGSEKRLVTFDNANPTNDSFIHLNESDEVVAIASGSTVGAFLQKTATGFEVSATIDGGTY